MKYRREVQAFFAVLVALIAWYGHGSPFLTIVLATWCYFNQLWITRVEERVDALVKAVGSWKVSP